jgi:hypothetical protein
MQKDYTKIDEMINERLDNAIEFNWTGGFERKFFIDFLHTQISLSEQSLLERVKKALIKDDAYIGKELTTLLTSLKHLPQEEVKNK